MTNNLEKPIGVVGMPNVYTTPPYTARYLLNLKGRIYSRIWATNESEYGQPNHMKKWERRCKLLDAVNERLTPLLPIEYD